MRNKLTEIQKCHSNFELHSPQDDLKASTKTSAGKILLEEP